MKNVRVNKAELLEKVKANREKHILEFQETVAGYNQEVLEVLKKQYQNASKGKPVNLETVVDLLSKPQSYEKDYDRAIAMLEMSADEVIDLASHEFNQLALDEWSWRGQFELANSTYGGKAPRM